MQRTMFSQASRLVLGVLPCLVLLCGCAQLGTNDSLNIREYLAVATADNPANKGELPPIGRLTAPAQGHPDLRGPGFLDNAERLMRSVAPSLEIVGEGSEAGIAFMRVLQGTLPPRFDQDTLDRAMQPVGLRPQKNRLDLRGEVDRRATTWRFRGQAAQGNFRGVVVDLFEHRKTGVRELFVQLWDSPEAVPQTYRDDQLAEHLIDRVRKLDARRPEQPTTGWMETAALLEQRLLSVFPKGSTLRARLADQAVVKLRHDQGPGDVARRLASAGFDMTTDQALRRETTFETDTGLWCEVAYELLPENGRADLILGSVKPRASR